MDRMMKVRNALTTLLGQLFVPLQTNALFFVSMYVLGVAGEWITLPHVKGVHLYDNLYLELFIDLYVACVVLTLLPVAVRRWVRRILYVVAYTVTVIDTYCFWKFKSTITPTMLLLVDETDAREASEFIKSYLSAEVITSPVGWLLLIMVAHGVAAWFHKPIGAWLTPRIRRAIPAAGAVTLVLVVVSICTSAHNKVALAKLMSARTIGQVEHTLTDPAHGVLYTPEWRLAFSVYANSLAAQQINRLVSHVNDVRVDSCSYTSPTIVLIIGESYGKHHSAQYGYPMPTTPRQIAREQRGRLIRFSDVVSPWNLTSFVFKNTFSLHVVGQPGEWCNYPLFPEVFRKAGYHVTFLTNQFLPKAKEAVYDFSGGFFLNNPVLSKAQFDTRNTQVHRYDDGLLSDYDHIVQGYTTGHRPKANLYIFHLLGQHVAYRDRYPHDRTHFKPADYKESRPELSDKQRRLLSYYDNAVLYNDSIVDQICRRFDNQDAIVIYMPDHGEECYEENRGIICRNHSAAIDYGLAKYEFEIPFWIYCTHRYAVLHPHIFKQAVEAKNRPYMTDALPHLLLYLAGIASPDYQSRYNLLSPDYDVTRPRLLKGKTDYNRLVPPKPSAGAVKSPFK